MQKTTSRKPQSTRQKVETHGEAQELRQEIANLNALVEVMRKEIDALNALVRYLEQREGKT